MDTAHQKVSMWNQKTYQRLKQALSLNLRRQILIAICDDLSLRNHLAEQLHAELGYPQLVNLNLNLKSPNPVAQIAQWFSQQRRPRLAAPATTFQILGVELLTRQPLSVQGLFLRHLQRIERILPQMESSLLFWLPRPWFHTIQQSAPEFWRWHTGIFEFEGEPTPVGLENFPKPEVYPEQAVRKSDAEQKQSSQSEHLWQILSRELAKFGESPLEEPIEKEAEEWEIGNGSSSPRSLISDQQSPLPNTQLVTTIPSLPKLQTLEDIEQLQQQFYPPQVIADAYLSLGNSCRNRLEAGDNSPENIVMAIQAYEQGLVWLEKENPHPQAADILNDLGNLYWMLSRCAADPEQKLADLERGIQSYHLALTKLNAIAVPDTYGMIQNNLGAAYSDLAQYQDAVTNLEQSICAYEEALRYRQRDLDPLKYASTQNNFGTAYWHLAQQKEADCGGSTHLQQAIAAYTVALSLYDPEQHPLNWAMIQNNLGTAYWNLAQYEQPTTFLDRAIDAYQNALKYRTPELLPAACAATLNNLATAYWHLASQWQSDPEAYLQYLQLSVSTYERAIALAKNLHNSTPPVSVNFDLFAAQNNLGLAHYQMAMEQRSALAESDRSAHLEAALNQHLQALHGFRDRPDAYQTALTYLIKTIRAFYQERGIQGQNFALSKVPGQLLPEILPRLG